MADARHGIAAGARDGAPFTAGAMAGIVQFTPTGHGVISPVHDFSTPMF